MDLNNLINTDAFYKSKIEDILHTVKYFLWITYDYIYPFAIKYILFLKLNAIQSWIAVFILFHLFYY